MSKDLRARLAAHKDEVLRAMQADRSSEGTEEHPLSSDEGLLEGFLADSALPAAIFRSRALDRSFVLARDSEALEALTEADQGLPVLFFGECEEARKLGLEGLGVLLDFRAEFGPSVRLAAVGRTQ